MRLVFEILIVFNGDLKSLEEMNLVPNVIFGCFKVSCTSIYVYEFFWELFFRRSGQMIEDVSTQIWVVTANLGDSAGIEKNPTLMRMGQSLPLYSNNAVFIRIFEMFRNSIQNSVLWI